MDHFKGRWPAFASKLVKGFAELRRKERKTIIVPDVDKFPGHIACDPDSKSEIVVPLLYGGDLFGVIDVDSAILNSFDEIDRIHLEKIAQIIAQKFYQSNEENN